jgi:uncharacterized protein with FMN-binding domain
MSLLRTKTAVMTLAGIGVLGALAGCSPTTPAAAGGTGSGSTGDSGTKTTTAGSNVTYEDGTYTEPGTYVSPGGTEHISVKMTLAKNIVTALTVTTVQADPTATGYEHMFEGGIDGVAVGKNINDLNIGVVAGSSLTSMGFNQALAAIKAAAKS